MAPITLNIGKKQTCTTACPGVDGKYPTVKCCSCNQLFHYQCEGLTKSQKFVLACKVSFLLSASHEYKLNLGRGDVNNIDVDMVGKGLNKV